MRQSPSPRPPRAYTLGVPIGRTTRAPALCVAWRNRSPVRVQGCDAPAGQWPFLGAPVTPVLRRDCASGLGLLPLEQRALPFAMVRVVAYDPLLVVKDSGPDTSAPKAVRGQKRLSTSAEALPLAREIGAGSRAPREIGAGSRGCLGLWRVRSERDHTPSGVVSSKE